MAMARQLTLVTPLGANVLLPVGLSGREAISEPFAIRLDLLARNDTLVPFEALLGQRVTAALTLGSGATRFFNGIVRSFGQGARGPKYTSYRAEVVPAIWSLTRKQTSRIFQDMSVPDILATVLSGIDVDFEVQGTFEPRNYCVQYRETDFNFVSRLMEEEGIFYFFKHDANGHQLVLANTPDSHPDVPGASTVVFDPNATQRSPTQVIYQFEVCQEIRSGKYTLRDYSFEVPEQNFEAQATILDSVQVGTVTHRLVVGGNDALEIYDYPGGYAKRFDGIDPEGGERPGELDKILPDANRTVSIRMEEETVPSLQVVGAATARQLTAGFGFVLQRHFNGDGPYVLTSVQHSAQAANVDTSNLGYTNQFTCIPAALPYRPARVTPRPTAGPQTAVVVGPAGEEIFTDKYGRVKVQFHWDREGKKDENSSCWIRVGAVFAGKQFGVINIPRIGDEVVVAFEEGDPDRPIIVGSVYNADNLPPPPWPPTQ
jgi:type VI secretion system secreted protein VgrG